MVLLHCRQPEQQLEEALPRLPVKGPDGMLMYERTAKRAHIPSAVSVAADPPMPSSMLHHMC
jgi:hypothetical protein